MVYLNQGIWLVIGPKTPANVTRPSPTQQSGSGLGTRLREVELPWLLVNKTIISLWTSVLYFNLTWSPLTTHPLIFINCSQSGYSYTLLVNVLLASLIWWYLSSCGCCIMCCWRPFKVDYAAWVLLMTILELVCWGVNLLIELQCCMAKL